MALHLFITFALTAWAFGKSKSICVHDKTIDMGVLNGLHSAWVGLAF